MNPPPPAPQRLPLIMDFIRVMRFPTTGNVVPTSIHFFGREVKL